LIPKLLHYVWFGPYPESCPYVEDWLNELPDYQLVRWTNDNPELKKYVDEAIQLFGGMETLTKKSMTYLSDMVRLLIVRDYGGIYMDHDIIVVKDFSELLESKKCVLTFQYDPNDFPKMHYKDTNMSTAELITFGGGYKYHKYSNRTVNNCFIAAEPNSPVILRAIELTAENHFRKEEDQYVFSDWGVGPSVMTIIAKELGLDPTYSTTIENSELKVYERSLLHPVHGAQRHEWGYEVYKSTIDDIITNKLAYTVHFHEHFGVSMLMENRLVLFPEWYKDFYEKTS
jgi:hypothetical protein